jgi:hypothetical protein
MQSRIAALVPVIFGVLLAGSVAPASAHPDEPIGSGRLCRHTRSRATEIGDARAATGAARVASGPIAYTPAPASLYGLTANDRVTHLLDRGELPEDPSRSRCGSSIM